MRMPNRVSEYFKSRAVAEHTMARFSTDARVALAHEDMAERFEAYAVEFDINRPGVEPPSVSPEYPKPSDS